MKARVLRAVLSVCLLGGIVAADAAAATGDLTQKPGTAGCISDNGLSALSLSPTRFRAAARGASIAARIGSRVSYRLSELATVRFRVERALPGRRVGGRCVKPKRSNRRAKRCTRYVTLRGGFTHRGKAGRNRFTFSGRLRARKLQPGRYRLRAVATDSAGNKSLPRRSRFRIVRR